MARDSFRARAIVSASLALLVAAALHPGGAAMALQDPAADTGIELVAPAEGKTLPYTWSVAPAAGGPPVATARERFGLLPVPPGEYEVRITWRYGETEVRYATRTVAAGQIVRVPVDTGFDLAVAPGLGGPPYTWSLRAPGSDEAAMLVRERGGFVPLPPGEYELRLVWEYGETESIHSLVTVTAGSVARATVDTGVEIAAAPGLDGPPYIWSAHLPGSDAPAMLVKGRLGFAPLPPGEYEIRLVWQYGETEVFQSRVAVTAGAVARAVVDTGFELAADPETGGPPYIWSLRAPGSDAAAMTVKGRFGFAPVPPGEYELRVTWVYGETEISPSRVTVLPGQVARAAVDTGVELVPPPDPEGAKAPYLWRVLAAGSGEEIMESKGRFGFVPIPPGEVEVRVTWVYGEPEAFQGKGTVVAGEILRFSAYSGIELAAVAEAGGPPYLWNVRSPGSTEPVTTAKGRFGAVAAVPGEYTVGIVWQYAETEVIYAPVTVLAGETERLVVDSGVDLAPPGSGEGAAPYTLSIVSAGTGEAVTGTKGRTGFVPLPPGDYVPRIVWVYGAPELIYPTVHVAAGRIARIDTGSGIELVAAREGAPPPLRWTVSPKGGPIVATAEKRFGIALLPPGAYEVAIQAGGGIAAATRSVVVEAGTLARIPVGEAEPPLEGDATTVSVAAGDTVVELRWRPPEGMEVIGYRVYRKGRETPIHGPRLLEAPRFADIGLSNGRSYEYIVTAVLADRSEWRGYLEAAATPARAR